jgi:hypothetical protein
VSAATLTAHEIAKARMLQRRLATFKKSSG